MRDDTRYLTVALEHLRAALDEITNGIGQTDIHIRQGSVRRSIGHLDMVNHRLAHERMITDSSRDIGQAVERAYQHAQRAWQNAHDLMNDWDGPGAPTLDSIRVELNEAIDWSRTAAGEATTEEALRP